MESSDSVLKGFQNGDDGLSMSRLGLWKLLGLPPELW
jgi:hypothetical protein